MWRLPRITTFPKMPEVKEIDKLVLENERLTQQIDSLIVANKMLDSSRASFKGKMTAKINELEDLNAKLEIKEDEIKRLTELTDALKSQFEIFRTKKSSVSLIGTVEKAHEDAANSKLVFKEAE